jgi:glycine cleavage system H lipoate-binding protein
MEGFKYVDIFATKGIEYVIAIVFLITLVWFWKWLNSPNLSPVLANKMHSNRLSLVDWFYLANNYYYHQGHSWVYPAEKNVVTIGIDDFAQKLIGKPSKLKLPAVGSELSQGENAIMIEIDGKNISFLAPVDGKVVAINENVLKSPEIINIDPYQKGWLLKVRSNRLKANLKNLLQGRVARTWIEETVTKLSLMISRNHGVVLQDGGTITNGFAKELDPDAWDKIASEFFLTVE